MLIDRRLASHFDWTLLALAGGLVLAGVLTIYSATYSVTEHRASGLAVKQFYWFLIGVAAMVSASTFDYHRLDRIAYPFYALGFWDDVLAMQAELPEEDWTRA